MQFSPYLVALIKRREGLSLKAYYCDAGVLTIGYGHTKAVREGDVISKEEAENLLEQDLQEATYSAAPFLADIELHQFQYEAIISMVFNIGPKLFRNKDGSETGLYKALKACDHDLVMDEMFRWDKASGKSLRGLTRRRGNEEMLYLMGTVKEGGCDIC